MKPFVPILALALACAALPAQADREPYWWTGRPPAYRDHPRDFPREYQRDYRPPPHFHQHIDHRRHRDAAALGAFGVGVILGSMLVPSPPRTVVVQSLPPPVTPLVIAPPMFSPPVPPERLWYFCESQGQYYPQVRYCPEGWRTVPAQ